MEQPSPQLPRRRNLLLGLTLLVLWLGLLVFGLTFDSNPAIAASLVVFALLLYSAIYDELKVGVNRELRKQHDGRGPTPPGNAG